MRSPSSIAFYRGQAQEVSGMLRKLARRLQTEWRRLANKDVVQAYSTMFRQFVGLLPVYVLAGRSTPQTQPSSGHDGGAALLDGHGHGGHGHGHAHGHGAGHDHEGRPAGGTDIAAVNQAREVFDEVLYHLLIVAENTSDFSRLATVALELDRYSERSRRDLQQLQSETGAGGRLLPAPPGGPFWLQVEDLTLWAPGEPRRLLVKELSVAMTGGDRLLICGPSGAGKTTLLRAIAGLWLQWTGSIRREMDARRVMFLPQRPYIQVGTLREQLLYPFGAGSDCSHGAGGAAATDDELKQIMQRVGLQPVLLRVQGDLGARRRWAEELSVGEQQRVSIARILVHKPAFAILDEATSANDTGHELTMYRCVQETCSAFVSVGHRESIEAFHTGKLTLLGEGQQGQWTLEPL
ncbi:unnamed protein product [Prorocentrum cordatum]|uniref:ABC transporter domain-containing protein n=1 Tax=Prorocentrum cordatum TaxID=2364126 RepID=A0ABN9PYD8_9DINO|nr:unnamed protein product [Polarella glacialis]